MTIRMIRGLIRIRSGSDPILIRIVFFDPFGSADYEFTIRSVSDPYPIRGSGSDRIFCGTLHMGNFLCYGNNNWANNDTNGVHYPNIGIPQNFIVENYEVFQVIKK